MAVVLTPAGPRPHWSRREVIRAYDAGAPFRITDEFHPDVGSIVRKGDVAPPVTLTYDTDKHVTLWR